MTLAGFTLATLRHLKRAYHGCRDVDMGGCRLRVLPYDRSFWDAVDAGHWEPETLHLCSSVISPGMSQVDLCGARYMGGDIVKAIVEKNQQLYGQKNLSFFQFDIINDSLPKADLIICRDCLVHLPLSDACKALHNFTGSNSTFLLTTTFPERSENCDIAPGKWRPINLETKPFCLPQPWKIINEQCSEADGAYSDKSLGLWHLTDLKMLLSPSLFLEAMNFFPVKAV